MAKQNTNLEQPSQEGPAENPVMNADEQPTQTEDFIIKHIHDNLDGAIETAENDEQVGCIDYNAEVVVSKYKICSYLQVQQMLAEYKGIKNCVSINLETHASTIQENVSEYIGLTGSINKALNESLDAIKVLKVRLGDVRDTACKLEAARTDSCNSEQLKAIGKLPEKGGESGLARFTEETQIIIDKADRLYERSDDLFEKGVKVAGILAFMNIGSLKELAERLTGDAVGLSENVLNNLKYLQGKVDACDLAYTEQLQLVGAAYFTRNHAHLNHQSLVDVKGVFEDLSELECELRASSYEDWKNELMEICNNIKDTFDSEIECNDKTGGEKFQ